MFICALLHFKCRCTFLIRRSSLGGWFNSTVIALASFLACFSIQFQTRSFPQVDVFNNMRVPKIQPDFATLRWSPGISYEWVKNGLWRRRAIWAVSLAVTCLSNIDKKFYISQWETGEKLKTEARDTSSAWLSCWWGQEREGSLEVFIFAEQFRCGFVILNLHSLKLLPRTLCLLSMMFCTILQ